MLQYTPARFLAGYDYLGRFPWLDIALEWEGDSTLQRKRSHVSDDLIRLVDAIARRARDRRDAARPAAPAPALPELSCRPSARALFASRWWRCIPGVGNVMRQWPPEHFATLVDLLIEKNGVNVVLVGGPEEAELAEQVLASDAQPAQPWCRWPGRTSLRGTASAAACLRAVYRQQQRPEAHRRGDGRADDRHPFGRGGCDRMGADRPAAVACSAT